MTPLIAIGTACFFIYLSDGYGLDIEDENIFFCNDNKWNISRAMECQGLIYFIELKANLISLATYAYHVILLNKHLFKIFRMLKGCLQKYKGYV